MCVITYLMKKWKIFEQNHDKKWKMNLYALRSLKKFTLLIKLLKSCLHWIVKAQLDYKYLVIISEIEHVEHNN